MALPAAFWYSPFPQTSHLVQLVRRCDEAVWNVLAGHDEHLRCAVLVSALIRSPRPHVGCDVHLVVRCDVAV